MQQTAESSIETKEDANAEPPTLDEIIDRHARPTQTDGSGAAGDREE